ncbi:O-antigen polymerase [Fictibacillus sp. JL2B1089]|uniref:O-antigen polymerase n=1 Tax=Fictibacillus sp. JL2B1089 TaxID=3399565 RepID=UPI003A84FEFE
MFLTYAMIWLIVLGISISLFKKAGGSLSILRPNLLSLVFYYSLFVSSFIGSLLIVTKTDQFYMMHKVPNDEYRLIGFILVCLVMVFLPLTVFVLQKLLGFNATKEFNQYFAKPVVLPFTKEKTEFYVLFAGLSTICLLAVAYTMLKLNAIPLLELIKGSNNAAQLRIEASRGFQGNVLIRNIFAIALTPILSIIAFIFAHKTREIKWVVLTVLLIGASFVITTYDLSKSPVFFYMLSMILTAIYIGFVRLSYKRILLIGIAGFVLLFGMYAALGANPSSFLSYNSGPIGRMFLSQIAPFYMHLQLFGNGFPFLEGSSFPGIINQMFDQVHARSGRVAMGYFYPEKVEAGTAGVLNTLFIGEAYANYSYPGVIMSILYMGMFLAIIYMIFLRLPKNPVFLGMFIYFTINIPRSVVGGFFDFIFNPLWIMISVFVFSVYFVIKVRIGVMDFLKNGKGAGQ